MARPMNIVIVDDNAVNLMLMAALARSATGREPVRFDDPVAGLDWCRTHGADLIVVDFMMRLPRAAEFRDRETGGHIQRMAHYAASIARHLGEPEAYAQALLTAAPMHDVGKLGTPDHILLKTGHLSAAEQVEMHRHAEI